LIKYYKPVLNYDDCNTNEEKHEKAFVDVQAKIKSLRDAGYLDDENTLFHAQAHQKIIEDFGRFPHRNDILKRESTVQELTYLTSGGYRP
jgi:uncharacterized protein (DUF924 family)